MLKAVEEENEEICERPQDTHCERPQPMSRIRKLSDGGVCCQGGGTKELNRRKLDVFEK